MTLLLTSQMNSRIYTNNCPRGKELVKQILDNPKGFKDLIALNNFYQIWNTENRIIGQGKADIKLEHLINCLGEKYGFKGHMAFLSIMSKVRLKSRKLFDSRKDYERRRIPYMQEYLDDLLKAEQTPEIIEEIERISQNISYMTNQDNLEPLESPIWTERINIMVQPDLFGKFFLLPTLNK